MIWGVDWRAPVTTEGCVKCEVCSGEAGVVIRVEMFCSISTFWVWGLLLSVRTCIGRL